MMRQILLFAVFITCMTVHVSAQQAVVASGGEATGSTGSLSFSVGEVDYKTETSASNIITQGVQQPYLANQHKAALINSLKLYPNPVSTTMNLAIACQDNTDYVLTVLDMYGRVIKSKKASCLKNNGFVTWNVSDLIPGVYIVKVSGKNIKGIPFIKF